MKPITLLLAIVLVASCKSGYGDKAKAHRLPIDRIQDVAQVQEFIRSLGKQYEDFQFHPDPFKSDDQELMRFSDSLKPAFFVKTDLDQNGYTDLFVRNHLLIMNLGRTYHAFELGLGYFRTVLFVNVPEGAGYFDYYFIQDWHSRRTPARTLMDRLDHKKMAYKFGGLVEYNANPKEYHIEQIDYVQGACSGHCPYFRFRVFKDRVASVYDADGESPLLYFGLLKNEAYDELISILNYIDFPNLQGNYTQNPPDTQVGFFRITYDGGKTKMIRDGGLTGTIGLEMLYQKLKRFTDARLWEKRESIESLKDY